MNPDSVSPLRFTREIWVMKTGKESVFNGTFWKDVEANQQFDSLIDFLNETYFGDKEFALWELGFTKENDETWKRQTTQQLLPQNLQAALEDPYFNIIVAARTKEEAESIKTVSFLIRD